MRSDRDHMFGDDETAEEARIRELKEQVEAGSGGETLSIEFEQADMPPGAREQFWQRVLQYNQAPWTSEYERLAKQGIELPPPEQLDDTAVRQKLDEIVKAMSKRNVFLEHTDHLSDRALYEQLYHETLHELVKDVPVEPEAFCSLDMIGSGNNEDLETYVRFYADDSEREEYRDWFPTGMPARESRPFDRDRHLPQPEEPRSEDPPPNPTDPPGEARIRFDADASG